MKEKSARVSVGSFILRARSLFSPEMVAQVRDLVELPEPLPFAGVKVETVHVPRYREHLRHRGVAGKRPEGTGHVSELEEYKILLLGALAGLRRNEIDVLPWSAFRWNEGVIRIETTEFYRPKSHIPKAMSGWIPNSWSFPRLLRAAQRRVCHRERLDAPSL